MKVIVFSVMLTVLVGCSSADNSAAGKTLPGSQYTCNSSAIAAGQGANACNSCTLAKCASETQTTLGSNPKAFEGACGAFLTCLCDCKESEKECSATCALQVTGECREANAASLACSNEKCSSECAE